MATVVARRAAAVAGYFVADAAVQPLHWIYNNDKLQNLLGDSEEIAFWEPSANPFYCLPTGSPSTYGDQTYIILESLVQNKGVDIPALKKAHYKAFGPEGGFTEDAEKFTVIEESPGNKKTYPGRSLPIKTQWRNGSVKEFVKRFAQGLEETGHETDESIDSAVKIVPVVALYAGRPEMLYKVEDVVRITQSSDIPVAFGLLSARFIEHYILNGRTDNAVEEIIKQLEDPKRQNPQSLDRAIVTHLKKVLEQRNEDHQKLAKTDMPGSFQLALHGAITNTDYVAGVNAAIRVGGCSASRGSFIGACLAAQNGMESIPELWKQKTIKFSHITSLIQQLCEIDLSNVSE